MDGPSSLGQDAGPVDGETGHGRLVGRCSLDVGKGEHHATAVTSAGKKVFDKRLSGLTMRRIAGLSPGEAKTAAMS